MMLPPLEAIGRGLAQAGERFALELATPQATAPTWSDFEWQMARAAAVLHGVSPLLAGALRWQGPAGWERFLLEQHDQTLQRHWRMAAALREIDEGATGCGLAVMALKGAALHALGIYAPGERPMADIDLLVRPADTERVAQMLVTLGYTQTWVVWKHRVFERGPPAPARLAPGEHHSYPLKIDLHERIAERLPVCEADITALVFPDEPTPGLNPYPSTAALLLHLVLHATDNMCGRAIRLMHLSDITRVAATATAADWDQFVAGLMRVKGLWWALPPLAMVSRYRPGVVPTAVLSALRADAPRPLRMLCDRATLARMSYASLSISAFPGLAWCTSPREAARYLHKRLMPNGEQRASRRLIAAERWSDQGPWSRMSQRRRMFHWFLRRPPRQASMYIVRAALAHPLQTGG